MVQNSAIVERADAPAQAGFDNWKAVTGSPCVQVKRPPSAVQRLAEESREELARLARLMRDLPCATTLRGVDGHVVTLGEHSARRLPSQTAACSLAAPVFAADGSSLAALELTLDEADQCGTSRQLLLALLQSTARAMSERRFRMQYAQYWVLAALHAHTPYHSMLLAIDRDHWVVGTDYHARRLFESHGRALQPLPAAREIFPFAVASLSRRHGESLLHLRSAIDGGAWAVLITPPDITAYHSPHGTRTLQHTRPRLDGLNISGLQDRNCPAEGFSSRVLQSIEDYVDTHLEAALSIEELARNLKVSVSHFTRSFRRATGLTPHTFVLHRRLHRAQELLARTDLSLVEIALATGFCDQSHFSRRFHQLIGLPPRAFRAHQR